MWTLAYFEGSCGTTYWRVCKTVLVLSPASAHLQQSPRHLNMSQAVVSLRDVLLARRPEHRNTKHSQMRLKCVLLISVRKHVSLLLGARGLRRRCLRHHERHGHSASSPPAPSSHGITLLPCR